VNSLILNREKKVVSLNQTNQGGEIGEKHDMQGTDRAELYRGRFLKEFVKGQPAHLRGSYKNKKKKNTVWGTGGQ